MKKKKRDWYIPLLGLLLGIICFYLGLTLASIVSVISHFYNFYFMVILAFIFCLVLIWRISPWAEKMHKQKKFAKIFLPSRKENKKKTTSGTRIGRWHD